MHGQHQPHREGSHRYQGEGPYSQLEHLGDDLPEEPGGVGQGAAGLQEKQGQFPQVIHELHNLMAGLVKKPVAHGRPAHPKVSIKIFKLNIYPGGVKEEGPAFRPAAGAAHRGRAPGRDRGFSLEGLFPPPQGHPL